MIYLQEEEIKSLLTWDNTLKATEAAMKAVSSGKAVIGQRVFTNIPQTPKWMLTMPGHLDDEQYGGWSCKLLGAGVPKNASGPDLVPSIKASIMLLDEHTGALKAVFSGLAISDWRTAAASAVATKFIHTPSGRPQKILAIFGCGEQGRAHAECFGHCFQFEEIRLWNRTISKAKNLAEELNEKLKTDKFKVIEDKENCARDSDIIITTTSPGSAPIIKYDWLKKGVHINAVGVVGSGESNEKQFELDEETYRHAHVYVDDWNTANRELAKLKTLGTDMKAEVGELILGKVLAPTNVEQLTVFQSLGMAAEDCAMARMIYDLYHQKNN